MLVSYLSSSEALSTVVQGIGIVETITYGLSHSNRIVAYMQVSLVQCKQLLRSIAPPGNLFLLLTLQELRRQGLTYIAFYVLQRAIESSGSYASALRQETGLADYEISRACKYLEASGLVVMSRDEQDRRFRMIRPTKVGIKIHDQLVSAAAKRLQKEFSMDNGVPLATEERRLAEAAESFRKGNRILRGPFQISFFDTHRKEMKS
jgi:DNA-binding MarR family transcriptional regulator